MNKLQLLHWLQNQDRDWQTVLDEIGSERMDQPGACGHWSMKDLVAHLTGWNRWLVARLQAAQDGEPIPSPPWPARHEAEDDINAWICETSHQRSLREVLDESHKVMQQLLSTVEGLPADVRIEHVEPAFYLVSLGDQRFLVGEFFDHFRDDHETEVRAWLARLGNR